MRTRLLETKKDKIVEYEGDCIVFLRNIDARSITQGSQCSVDFLLNHAKSG